MEFRKVLALRGPNIWANYPVLEAWVDLQELKDSPSNTLSGFNDRLMAWLPTMVEHRCSVGERGGFFERLRNGTYMGHILEHVTLELQSLVGNEVGFGRARETAEEGVYRVVVEYLDETLGRACLDTAFTLLKAAVSGEPFDVKVELARLRRIARDVCLGPSTRAIFLAAKERGIPAQRLNTGSLVQLGYGSRQRRILTAMTDRTSAIAVEVAQDKQLTRSLLQEAGVPTPSGRPVTSAEDAWEAACELGVPVVVKPQDGNQGRGVATNLTTREQVVAAYQSALKESEQVIVEKFAPGNDYRLLVVGGRLVAAARREAAHVIGNGQHTIVQLIDQVNSDPRRGDDHEAVLTKIRLDSVAMAVLTEQGFTPESVPPAGVKVLIRRNANLSTGGTALDVTDRVHPEVAVRAIDAARTIGLDIAGIDVVAHDISRPLEEQGAVIVEVNAGPGLRMHLEPSAGISRPVGEAIVGMLFPAGDTGRIPIVAVSGVNGKTTTTRLIAHIIKGTGVRVGMTCTDGIYIQDRRIDNGDCSGPQSARSVLMNSHVDAAVFETARGGVLRAGLGFDQCDVAVVTNIGQGDHLGLSDVETLDKLAAVKRTIVDVVSPCGYAVLNAADPLVAGMAAHCPGNVVFFTHDENHPVLAKHRAAGGRIVFVRDNAIILADDKNEERFLTLDRIPLTLGGKIKFQVENVLAAVAAAWSLKTSMDLVRTRVETFHADLVHSPGRFNILEINGGTVVVDYGHNASALEAIIEAITTLPHTERTIVYSTAGDRRDCDLVDQGKLLGAAFDRVILYEDHYLRGRPEGQIIGLLRQGMADASRAQRIDEVRGAIKAVEMGLMAAAPGHLVVIQADTIDETVQYLRQYLDAMRAHDGNESTHEEELVGNGRKQSLEPAAAEPVVSHATA